MRMRHMALVAVGAALLLAPEAGAQGSGNDSDRWTWNGTVGDGNQVFVRNLNGPIRVEGTSGSTVEVVAYKVARRRGRTEDVKITVEQRTSRGDVVICAIWNERTRCDETGYRSSSDRRWWDDRDRTTGDVSVEFVVRLPKNVRVTASSVNGGLEIDGVDSEVNANTVNGSIVARSNAGPVNARTVNGSLTIRAGNLGRESLSYSTVNGAISLEIPENSNADVELRTVNGGISTDFPLTIEGRFSQRSVRGTIGRGGPLVRLSTTNGAIRLRRQ